MPSANNCVFIAFHLRNSLNASADAARLGVLLQEIFGPEQIETVDLDTQDKEVVYRVNRPVIATTEEQESFFRSLSELFVKSEDFHPHFTQIYG